MAWRSHISFYTASRPIERTRSSEFPVQTKTKIDPGERPTTVEDTDVFLRNCGMKLAMMPRNLPKQCKNHRDQQSTKGIHIFFRPPPSPIPSPDPATRCPATTEFLHSKRHEPLSVFVSSCFTSHPACAMENSELQQCRAYLPGECRAHLPVKCRAYLPRRR